MIAGLGKMFAPSATIATSLQKPGGPGSGPYWGVASTLQTASAAMLPQISLPLLAMALETMTSMNVGKVAGGGLLPGLVFPHVSSRLPPRPAVTSHRAFGF